MKKLLDDVEKIAYESLSAFGFEEEDVLKLVKQAKKDLIINLDKLKVQLNSNPIDKNELSSVLHAIKGLLYQMGDHSRAEQIDEIREDIDSNESVRDIEKLLLG